MKHTRSKAPSAEQLNAIRESRRVASVLKTKGWKPRVWENACWHWCLTNSICGMSLHVTKNAFGPDTYWCMMDDADAKNTFVGCVGIKPTDCYSDPNKAVAEIWKVAARYFEQQERGFINLKRAMGLL